MMKKSFFQNTINISMNCIVLSIFLFFVEFGLEYALSTIDSNSLLFQKEGLMIIQEKLSQIAELSHLTSQILLILATTLILFEFILRLLKDSIWNYFKSIYQTILLRRFLKQEEHSKAYISLEGTTATHFNPILKNYNKAVLKCTVDIRKRKVYVLIKYPKSQQAQKLLRDMEEHIKEEISNRNPNYYFSAPNRVGSKLLFTGTRR